MNSVHAKRGASPAGGVGIVATKFFHFAGSSGPFLLENGERLSSVTIAYETYGTLNSGKSNAILLLHALSGDAHAAGYHEGDERPGWWDRMVGPGKAFDTDRYFVICSNVIGGCKGSTGPSSLNPETGRPYGLGFPLLTIKDMVRAQRHLIDHLGIDTLLCAAGGSMGGMQVLEWMATYPERIRSAIPIATALRHSPQQIAFNEVGRQAIMADPCWKFGNYYDSGHIPAKGLAVARMVGHITYMSNESMDKKFGRHMRNNSSSAKFTPDFEVERYLRDRGDNFVRRFDANSYLYITKAMDYFDIAGGKLLHEVFRGLSAKVLVIAFTSDWLYPASQSREIVRACKMAGIATTYCEIDSPYGHDAFLLDTGEEAPLIRHFLSNASNGKLHTFS